MANKITSFEAETTKIVSTFIISALVLLLLTVGSGLLGSIYYSKYFPILSSLGIPFQTLRPFHTVAAVTWIYMGGLAVVFSFLFSQSKQDHLKQNAIFRRTKLQLKIWLLAGILAFGSLIFQFYTGREYIVFHPIISILILWGWILYARSFFQVVGFNLKKQPVYIWMLITSIFLFIYSFVEAHAYLLSYFETYPLRDIAVQWKSYGALVGSFNLIVYGSLIYVASRLTKEMDYAYSNTAFFLFFIGTLNSFTNFAHHTYHIPQSLWVKWIAFSISMLEIIILFKVLLDMFGLKKMWQLKERFPQTTLLLLLTTIWTALQLILSLLISVPPLNSFVHGTLIVLAHSMGTTIGIDTMAVLAGIALLVQQHRKMLNIPQPSLSQTGLPIAIFNIGLLILWLNLIYEGLRTGVMLFDNQVIPSILIFSKYFSTLFLMGGGMILLGIFWIVISWIWSTCNKR